MDEIHSSQLTDCYKDIRKLLKSNSEKLYNWNKRWDCCQAVVHAFNPSTWEADAGEPLSSEDSQSYTEKPCLKHLPQKGELEN